MKHIWNKFATALLPINIVAPIILTSCHKTEIKIENIELYPDNDVIRPGESQKIRAIALPSFDRINNLNWELVECDQEEISISQQGDLSVQPTISIIDPIIITIKASLINNPDIVATTQVTLLWNATYDFQGFKDDAIYFPDIDGNTKSMPIIKTKDDFTYETKQNIDIFHETTPPEGWSTFFYFQTLVGGDNPNFMSFTIPNKDTSLHAIQWSLDYDDSSWTDTIPSFYVIDYTKVYEDIEVHFSCDPRVTLTIHFSVWANPMQTTSTIFSYVGNEPDETHNIDYLEESVYRMNIFCPANAKTGIIADAYNSIYCYRPKYEYTNFTIQFEPNEVDQEILDMFTQIYASDPVIVERPIDHLRTYKLDIEYELDLSKKIHTYEYWDYNDILLGSIWAYDKNLGPAGRCEVWLRWLI